MLAQGNDTQLAFIIWETRQDAPRFGAGIFRTRAEAEAVANFSMARGRDLPGELEVKPLAWGHAPAALHTFH